MTDEITKITLGALMHDIGKVVQRAEGSRTLHSKAGEEFVKEKGNVADEIIIHSIKYHHADQIRTAHENINPYAYLTYIADNIAAFSDRREDNDTEDGGWDKKVPLSSVFNFLHKKSDPFSYRPVTLDVKYGINVPLNAQEKISFDEYFYKNILTDIEKNIQGMSIGQEYINSVLELFESTCSYVPSDTSKGNVADISLYDHIKLTSAIAGVIYYYLEAENVDKGEYEDRLYQKSKEFYDENFGLLYSIDISGIQQFIYTIHDEGALKSLRGRSFYLELFTENFIDELLEKIGLSRCNLIYSGGGHAYMLLPNTEDTKNILDEHEKAVNKWLMEKFDVALYLVGGYTECSANDFNYEEGETGRYSDLFKRVSRIVSDKKLHRYSIDDIKGLNERHIEGRECKICKKVDTLNDKDQCEMCASLIELSRKIQRDTFFSVVRTPHESSLPIFREEYIVADNESELRKRINSDESYIRSYGKNDFYMGELLSAKLWVGDYYKDNELANYAKESKGIDRLGVVRMDIDNLGKAFISGFKEVENGQYNTLSRTATFSRHMSLFFKRYINLILENSETNFLSGKEIGSERDVSIIYSGGDDVFLIGSWCDSIEATIDIRNYFKRYVQNKLTISCGIGLYPPKYPVRLMADEVGKLEDFSKDMDDKNAITLFEKDKDGTHRYKWDVFLDEVIGEKFKLIKDFLGANPERGKTFLYRILELLRGADERINFARFVYVLSRLEPDGKNEYVHKKFKQFSKCMYEWYQNKNDRNQLITAIYLLVYTLREKEEGENDK